MKSLLDLQQAIRTLEHDISRVMKNVQALYDDIDEMRNTSQSTDVDYGTIELLAKNFSFGKHPIDKLEDGRACQLYLEMLLNVVRLDMSEEHLMNRLVFIQWIQTESRINWSLEDLFKDCYKMEEETFSQFVELLTTRYRECFIVDALVAANMCGTANAEIYRYIAGVAMALGVGVERLVTLSNVARLVLCENINHMNRKELEDFIGCARSFKHYVKSNLLEKCINCLREVVVEAPDDEVVDFRWKVKQGQVVQEGEVVATYRRRVPLLSKSNVSEDIFEEIKSPVTGMIWEFRDECINYGVIAHGSDDKASIKAWVKSRR